MNELGKKLGFLKGILASSEKSADASKDQAVYSLLEELVEHVESLEEMFNELNDYVESIDDDLSALEADDDGFFEDHEEEFGEFHFDDEVDDVSSRLRVLNGKPSDSSAEETDDECEIPTDQLAGALCPKCKQMFLVPLSSKIGALFICPHCDEKIAPVPLTPENAPIASPAASEQSKQ